MTEHAALPAELRAELLELGTSTLYEASGLDCALDPGMRALFPGASVAARAYPLSFHPADNLALHVAVAEAPPGSVLVADAGRHLAGYWGEVLARAAMRRGIEGLVIDGGARDIDALARLPFPVFARGARMTRTSKHDPGRQNLPAICGGVRVDPGDVVVGDADGVVVLPADELDRVVEAARARAATEQQIMARIAAGELTLDLFGLREPLEHGRRQ